MQKLFLILNFMWKLYVQRVPPIYLSILCMSMYICIYVCVSRYIWGVFFVGNAMILFWQTQSLNKFIDFLCVFRAERLCCIFTQKNNMRESQTNDILMK